MTLPATLARAIPTDTTMAVTMVEMASATVAISAASHGAALVAEFVAGRGGKAGIFNGRAHDESAKSAGKFLIRSMMA